MVASGDHRRTGSRTQSKRTFRQELQIDIGTRTVSEPTVSAMCRPCYLSMTGGPPYNSCSADPKAAGTFSSQVSHGQPNGVRLDCAFWIGWTRKVPEILSGLRRCLDTGWS